MNQTIAELPLVSLVIPVYNAMPYLVETLDSISHQGLDARELEVILVNDGSNDGSETVLAEYAQKNPNFRVLNQPNSGGPADPCNKGIAAVRGKYFFVLGSDDVLAEGALGELTAYAEREGSDIVLAKMAGLNGRHAPSSMFKQTKADAHLVEDNLFMSLTAIKLFRTDLVHKTGARNPTHLRVGSDQPFTAACYLVADKISVCADRAYVLIRKREDGKNVTSSPRNSLEYAALLTATVEVIVQWTEPGEIRDGVLRRPVRGALHKALEPRFLALGKAEQESVVAEIQQAIGPYFTDEVAAHLGARSRLKVRLALEGRTDALRALIAWQKSGGQELLVRDEGGFRLDLPVELVDEIGSEKLRDVKVVGAATLDDLIVENGRLQVEAGAHVRQSLAPPDSVTLRIRRRGTDELFDVQVHGQQAVQRSGANGVKFRAEVDATEMAQGVWDVYVVQRFGDSEIENRLGRNRSDRVTAERRLLIDQSDGYEELGVAYFTRNYGNLSLDIGYVLLTKTGPAVRVISVLRTEPGRHTALLRADPAESVRLTLVQDREGVLPDAELSFVPLGDGLLAAPLPSVRGETRPMVKVENPHESVMLDLPEVIDITAHEESPVTAASRSLSGVFVKGKRAAKDVARRMGVRRPGLSSRPSSRAQR